MHRKAASLFAFVILSAAMLAIVSVDSAQSETLKHSEALSVDDVRIDRQADGARLTVNGYERLSDVGSPALPYRVISILLPQGEVVETFRFEAGKSSVISKGQTLSLATPLLSEHGGVGAGKPAMVSGKGGAFPEELGRYLGTGYFHGRAIASFALYPVRATGDDVSVVERIDVTVETSPKTGGEEVVVRERFRNGFQERVAREISDLVVNPEMIGRYQFDEVKVPKPRGGFQPTSYPSLEGSAVDYVIVTTDALASSYQELADWKTSKGVPTVVRTVEWIVANTRNGSDLQETIRFFVRDAYAKWGMTYLLLGGDTDVLPPRMALSRFYQGGTSVPVDMYFSCLDGTWNDDHDDTWGEGFFGVAMDNPDLYAEVYNGRTPCSTPADVAVMVGKVKEYEAATTSDYMDRFAFLAEVLFPADWTDPDPISLNGGDFAEFIVGTSLVGLPLDIVKMYQTHTLYTAAVPENISDVLDSLNAGFNHVNHIGHGYRFNMSVADASILTNDADALINDGRQFNLYMLNCTAAAFNFFCLGEHFLKNANGGAVTVIGANESAFPNASSSYMNEYYDLLFQDDVVHIGEAFAKSRLPKTAQASAADNVDQWTHYIYTILADPEMSLFTGEVDTVDVFHPASVSLGPNAILVNVTAGGLPVDSATVCLSKDDDDYQVGTTNSIGNVIIDFTAESAGSISVVVTGLNIARHQSYIEVTATPGAYVNYSTSTVDEDSVGGSYGNGDGIVDAGETVDFTLELTNTGSSASDSVWVVLRTTTGSVTILDSIAEFGVIGSGGTETALDPVRVHFDASLTDETVVDFELEIHDTSPATWDDTFKKEVHAPELALTTLRIDDTLGNGDGIINPGEPFLLFDELKNYGTGTAYGLEASLADLELEFIFVDSTDTYPDITPFMAAENVSGFHIMELDTISENDLEVTITDLYGRTIVDVIELRVPAAPTSLNFDSSLGPDRLEISWFLSIHVDVTHYYLYQSTTQGGPYTRSSLDPVEHGVFLADGLAPSTKYYFVATSIDDSGNESLNSVEVEASTNPPQTMGFPIQMALQATSDPAVGDIDGDGDNEIVVGNKHVYAWHHDGIEMRDGDNDPQSWGVLNTEGDIFTAGIALARLDANPGLEIIAADINTQSVYVMDYNGDLLPGWPQVCERIFWAPPVAGDIDGDADFEIIAVDERGAIYAWHHDGSEYRDGDSNPSTQGIFYRTPTSSFHYSSPALCDIDGDGKDEIILGTFADSVYCLNEDGTSVPGWPFALPGDIAGSVATGDVDDDGLPEVVVHSSTSELYLLNHDATIAPGFPRFVADNKPFFRPSMALGDFTGDGKLEIAAAHSNNTQSRLYLIDHLGNNLPGWPIVYSTSTWTESSPVIGDLNGDSQLDVVICDEDRFVYAFDMTGALLAGFPIATASFVRATPTIADVDQDSDVDLVVHSFDQNLYVYDINATYDENYAPWPSFQANSHRNGKHGFNVPTAVGNALFTFTVGGDAIDLVWMMDVGDETFDLERSQVDDGRQGVFKTLAQEMSVNARGTLQYRDASVEMGGTYVYRLKSRENPDEEFTTQEIYIPITRADLAQNYPNPFNPTTKITYFVPEGGARLVNLVIYDVKGSRVRTLVDEARTVGKYAEVWNGRNDQGHSVSSGVYFYRLSQPGFTSTKKMILLK